jgi:UDP-GlcNAc:undecaprenyl-phosphate/decaprenyl-phosphate GlcNAc-1-phosphate transferase
MKKLKKVFLKFIGEVVSEVKRRAQDKIFDFAAINLGIVLFQLVYIQLRKVYLVAEIPLWYTRVWGDAQLASKGIIYLIPLVSLALIVVGVVLMAFLSKFFVRYAVETLLVFVTFANLLLSFQLVRIILISSVPFESLLSPLYISLLLPFIIAFSLVGIILPPFISFAKEKGLITNPEVHAHPGMLLDSPTARGGGVVYTVVFLIVALIFVGVGKDLAGLYLALILLGVLGFADDYQNTHPKSGFKLLENPLLRLLLLLSVVSIIALSGITILDISNPFGEVIDLQVISFLPSLVTVVWIVWLMNVLSWSNGIDGQFSGIAGIASLVVAILSLRFAELEPIHKQIAVLAAISAGASFGFLRKTWHPSKIMWGFGAMSVGLVLASLSILTKSKIVASMLIILIPFLDAFVTVLRRILQRKNPLKGDRGHLHHLLLDRGWSVKKIAIFYWVTTIFFGLVGILTSDKYMAQVFLILAGLVAFFIITLNVIYIKGNGKSKTSETDTIRK